MRMHDALFERSYRISLHNNFRIEDLMGPGMELDFTRPFMPESLARTQALPFLSPDERRILNQIRGNTYLCIFGIVEEFILPFLLDHVRPRLADSDAQTRALLQFAGEEAKHIELFRRFQRQFARGFDSKCEVIGPAAEIGKAILAHHPLAVGLAILSTEWMTQAHYLESMRDNEALDPHFKNLLKHHWIEESQHALLDMTIVEALAAQCSPEERARAFDEYLEIGNFIATGLAAQVDLDLESLQRKTGRRLSEQELALARTSQLSANRYTYLGSGMVHPKFRESLAALGEGFVERLDTITPEFL